MSTEPYDRIFEQFPPVSAAEWKEKIIRDLKGDAYDKLIWHSKEGIDVLPFYTKEDNEKYQLQIPPKSSGGWQITERVIVDDIKEANREALHALNYGATSIIFNLKHTLLDASETDCLTNGILKNIAPVYFEDYLKDNKSVLEHEIPDSCTPVILIPKQETIISELVYALQKGLEGDISVNRFHFYTGQNYFFEIARLRAFRWLWKQVCQLKNEPYQLTVFCETAIQNGDDKYEYSNILRNTTAAMSAVLGGSDAVIINSHDIHNGNSDFGKHIARNVHHILQQEAYFAEIEDAVKGSYYIEYLTFKLAQKAWEQFRNS
ncbi:MAG: hypothetical protein IPM95_01775 [Sphingobacteriales bacterium]|jgi:methylmalonyl-CoA mutase|nr:hypothetical protein [Sphingobacteriales bacterium]